MATTPEGAIQKALLDRLETLVLTPAHPVAWPNVKFTKPSDNRYLEARFIPNGAERVFIGSTEPHKRIGFLQVNVRDGIDQGPRVVETAGLVAAHFVADLRLSADLDLSVRIISAPDVNDMIVERAPPGVLVPVLIPFECWA